MSERLEQLEDLLFGDMAAGIAELKALVAAGDPDAMYVLGMTYYDGDGVLPDSSKCAALLEAAAAKGHIKATHDLGCFHYYGYRFPPAFRDLRLSAELLKVSSARGYTPSMTFLGSMYENGEGVDKDLEQARRLYQAAAELGDDLGKEQMARLAGA